MQFGGFTLIVKVLPLLIGYIAASQLPYLIGDPGVGWHLRTGQWIFEHGSIPTVDPFLAVTAPNPLICTQWLADLLYWLIFLGFGFQGLNALVIVSFLVTFLFIVPRICLQSHPSPLVLAVGLCMGAVAGATQLFVRPVHFSFLLFAVCLLFHRTWRSDPERYRIGYLVGLPSLFVLWANLHPAFPLGWIVLVTGLVDLWCGRGSTVWRHRLILGGSLALCVIGTALNPYGTGLHENIGNLMTSDYFHSLMMEWRSPDFHDRTFRILLVQIAVSLALLALVGWRGSLGDLFLFILFLVLALVSRRYLPFFAIVATPFIVAIMQEAINAKSDVVRRLRLSNLLNPVPAGSFRFPLLAVCIVVAISLSRGGSIERGVAAFKDWRPVQAVEAIANNGGTGAIFHSLDHGGYLTFRFYPERRAWIDDRNELNGEEIYREYFELHGLRDGWREVLAKYQFEYLLLDLPSPLAVGLRELGGWEELYRDAKTLVLKKVPSDSQ